MKAPRVLCINTGGPGNLHGLRARRLAGRLQADVTFHDVDKTSGGRGSASRAVWRLLQSQRWDMVYQEGTGIAAGACLIRAARAWGQRYVVSSGDPVGGFFRVTRGPLAGAFFDRYERLLYRHSAGFIGWTPYLTGAALRLGARRGVTVEGAVDLGVFRPLPAPERWAARERFGIEPDHLVCGVVGSLNWTPRQNYCYGLELIEALKRLRRPDVSVLIVGDGDGRPRLEAALPAPLKARVVFAGRLPEAEVVSAMNAMDIGFVTQTLDELGSFRLTTKLPEYLACGVPVAMSPIPGFWDYAQSAGWPLPARHPASEAFHEELAAWLDGLDFEAVRRAAARAPSVAAARFDYDVVGERFCAFLHALLAADNAEGREHGARRSS